MPAGRRLVLSLLLLAALVTPAVPPAQAATQTGTATNFELVGHEPLFDRGVNAALAIYDHTVYVGSRSDGTHLHSGVQIVDVSDPAHPSDTGEIPLPSDLMTGYTSREMRVWPQQKLLMVVYFGCSAILHACASDSDVVGSSSRINFFDLSDEAHPLLVQSYTPSVVPHELFLWLDPAHPASRALLYFTSPNQPAKQLTVADISGWRSGSFPEIATMAKPTFDVSSSDFDLRLHSLSLSPDGRTGYLAYLGGGVMLIDTSDLASAKASPTIRLITPIAGRAYWDNQGAHSDVPIPGTHYLFTTEEIYGKGVVLNDAFGDALGGCPWGWVRIVDAADPTHLRIVAQYRADENDPSCTGITTQQDNFSSYASHNPTVFPGLALLTWHSAGLRAVDLCDPVHPSTAGLFVPTPNAFDPTHTQDPALEPGSNGTIAWSYPIVHNGLIYYTDIANGLYIVRYTGRNATSVAQTAFYEGNSNVGDAGSLPGAAQCPAGSGSGAGGASAASLSGGSPNTSGARGWGAPAALVALLALAWIPARRRRRPRA